jgi:hypothetical protein
MLKDKSQYGEAGYVAEELLGDEEFELNQVCLTIKSLVERKVFTLEKALKAYGVAKETYAHFLVKKQLADLAASLSAATSSFANPSFVKNHHGINLDTPNFNTLRQVTVAIGQVQKALQDVSIPSANRTALEDTLLALRDVQNDIIIQSAQSLVDALKEDNTLLEQLSDKINKDAAQLDKIAATIKTVSNTVGILINVVTVGVSGGVI